MAKPSKWFLPLVLGTLLGACAPAAKPEPPALVPAGADAAALAADPCALRMQDIAGAMLVYYNAHHGTLPPTLEALAAASPGAALELTSPGSGKPFAYFPAGLSAPGESRQLLLYDPAPVHAGWRWGIVASTVDANQPLIMLVVPLEERVLKSYLPAAAPQPRE